MYRLARSRPPWLAAYLKLQREIGTMLRQKEMKRGEERRGGEGDLTNHDLILDESVCSQEDCRRD